MVSEKLEKEDGYEESKAVNKVYFFLCLVLGCAVVKGCGL
ncbi:putative lipoprotein [Acinetobacter baumannii UH10707]|nr:putative lipoprotein [Acinetobacter baumannii UH2907]ETR57655.1 putative lipoprotein [Acinetobacter baumannii UH10707]